MNLCEYKNIFGEPKKGIHSYRFFGVAIVDVLLTIIISSIIAYIFSINFIKVLILTFLLGIIMHRIFCVPTTIDVLLFGK